MAKMVRNSSKSGWICFRMANNGWKWTSKWPKTVLIPENGFTLFKTRLLHFLGKLVVRMYNTESDSKGLMVKNWYG